MTHELTLRDCVLAVKKWYGIDMVEMDGYPTTYAFKNRKVSIRLYRTGDGVKRIQIIPLDDVLNDQYTDIKNLNDLARATEPYRADIEVKQLNLFGAW